MAFLVEARGSDSLLVESVMHGCTVGEGSTIRPAEAHWHMVLSKFQGSANLLVVGPLSTAGLVSFTAGAEILWTKFKLGAFMPHLPTQSFRDVETPLPGAAGQSFWLKGSAWQFPNFENVETFIQRLAREEILVRDPVVAAALDGQAGNISPRTVRHRFLRAAGLAHNHIQQIQRAQQAQALLQQGVSILDTAFAAGYWDQAHLTRSLKQLIGYTPAQILRSETANS